MRAASLGTCTHVDISGLAEAGGALAEQGEGRDVPYERAKARVYEGVVENNCLVHLKQLTGDMEGLRGRGCEACEACEVITGWNALAMLGILPAFVDHAHHLVWRRWRAPP